MKKLMLIAFTGIVVFSGCSKEKELPPQSGQAVPQVAQVSPAEINILKDALSKDPKNTGAWINLGNLMMDSARDQEAIEAYEKALALDPKNVDVRVDLGTCYRRVSKPTRAVEEYRKALKINPNHLNAHRNLGVVLLSDLKDKAGVKELEKYLELAPFAPDASDIRQTLKELKSR